MTHAVAVKNSHQRSNVWENWTINSLRILFYVYYGLT